MPRAMTFYAQTRRLFVGARYISPLRAGVAGGYLSCQADTFQGVPSLVVLRTGPETRSVLMTNFGRVYRGIEGRSTAS